MQVPHRPLPSQTKPVAAFATVSASTVSPGASSSTRSITLRSSRTFPGHAYFPNASRAARAQRLRLPAVPLIQLLHKVFGEHANIFGALAQRRQRNRKHKHAMIQIFAERALPHLLFQIPVRRHNSRAHPPQTASRRPTRSISPSSCTRSNFACIVSGMSPISSKNNVPRCACSNFPCAAKPRGKRALLVPEKLGLHQLRGTAAQFCEINGPFFRGLFSCSVRATSSLPVPVSPRIQIRVSLAAT